MNKRTQYHIFGGGTVQHIRPHLALSAPAYGKAARTMRSSLQAEIVDTAHLTPGRTVVNLHLTRMASGSNSGPETNEDIRDMVNELVGDPTTRMIVMNAALCDFTGHVLDGLEWTESGKDRDRLRTDDGFRTLSLRPTEKILSGIRKVRKDIFLVAFKTTAGATLEEQFERGLTLLKKNSCNLVLANDVHTRQNMIITPEQSVYGLGKSRDEILRLLMKMAHLRCQSKFTRSTVVDGWSVDWNSNEIPANLREVVNYCIEKGAYKPFMGSTVGHFATRVRDGEYITSKRKTDFNQLGLTGMVRIEATGEDTVIAHGARPSVGGQSQRIIFAEHPEMDNVVHAHVPLRAGSKVPLRSQLPYECGSHECGRNTSHGLADFGVAKAVMLDRHGPNVVFDKKASARDIIQFIDENFDLAGTTSGV